jgi:hypothetical protein
MQLKSRRFKATVLHTEHQLWHTNEVEIGDFLQRPASNLRDPASFFLTVVKSAARV